MKKSIDMWVRSTSRKSTKNTAGCALVRAGADSTQFIVSNAGDEARTEVAALEKALTEMHRRYRGGFTASVYASHATAVSGIYVSEHSRPRWQSIPDGDLWKRINALCKAAHITIECYSDVLSPMAKQSFRQANAYAHKERQGILTNRALYR